MMASKTARPTVAARPKPKGSNVRAFIENLEKGEKPQPDFFKTNPGTDQVDTKEVKTALSTSINESNNNSPSTSRKSSVQKPLILHKKPSLTPDQAKPAVERKPSVIVVTESTATAEPVNKGSKHCSKPSQGKISSTVRPKQSPPPPPLNVSASKVAASVLDPASQADEDDTKCLSEDSGLCDLKYSGSISSNHSSSHDPSYQTVSEVGSGKSDDSSSCYFDPALKYRRTEEVTYSEPHDVCKQKIKPHVPPKPKRSAYAYHVPSKVNGTLPRNKKTDVFIGKAVAKGRSTLKKRKPSDKQSSQPLDEESKGDKSATMTSSMPANSAQSTASYNDSESEFDDSEWETDSEPESELSSKPSASQTAVDDSDYDTYMLSHKKTIKRSNTAPRSGVEADSGDYVSPTGESFSQFYTELNRAEEDVDQKLVTLMRDRSSKKQKQAQFTKRFQHIKKNIRDIKEKESVQKLVQSSSDKFSAVKSLIGKLKKPKTPKRDYKDSASLESLSDINNILPTGVSTQISNNSTANDSDISDCNLQSVGSSSSDLRYTKSSGNSRFFTPRVQTNSSDMIRLKTQSAAVTLDPPPLPPRNAQSQYFDIQSEPLAPVPPPRTTSILKTESDLTSSIASSVEDLQHHSPVGAKAKPIAAPRSPKLHSCNSDLSVLYHGTRDQASYLVSEDAGVVHKANSSPSISTASPTPRVPERRESSKTLVPPSLADDESIVRKNEILNAAKMRNRNNSLHNDIDEEPGAGSEDNQSTTSSDRASFSVGSGSDSVYSEALIAEEPLYQTYHECKMSRSMSIPGKASTLLKKSGQPSMSLWSSMPQVINSAILDQMSSEEIKLQEAMFEVITSEASYLRSLNILVDTFVESDDLADETFLPARERKSLFSNIKAVRDVSAKLFNELEKHWKNSIILTEISEIISAYATRDFDVYVKYCSNQSFQDRVLKKLSENKEFKDVLFKLEKLPQCQGLSMSSFLLLPMQRITRYPLLVDAILRRQEIWSDQGRKAQLCYEQLKKVVKKCNEGARKMEQAEQVINVENKLVFNKIKKVPLASAQRQLIKQGELVHLSSDGGKSTTNILTSKPKSLLLYLFNDLLLVTKKKGDAYSVIDYASRVNVQIEVMGGCPEIPAAQQMLAKSSAKFPFMLVLLENHQKKHSEYLMSCMTDTERTRWTAAFNPVSPDFEGDDKIYESWDCPQVQVIHTYSAQQPDELNLVTGELINILKKTADGWYEGERVSDGQTGWLPSSYVVELPTEHTRARHLKERYKLLQAAAKLNKRK